MKTLTFFPKTLSSIDLELYGNCPLRWFRERCQYYRVSSFNINLSAGDAFAKGLDIVRKSYYNNRLPEREAIEKGKYYAIDLLQEAIDGIDDYQVDGYKTPARIGAAIEKLFEEYPLDGSTFTPSFVNEREVASEVTLEMELPYKNPDTERYLTYKGRLDFLGYENDRLVVVDDKLSDRSIKPELFLTDGKSLGYALLVKDKYGVLPYKVVINRAIILKNETRIEPIIINITPNLFNAYCLSFQDKIDNMIKCYNNYKDNPDVPNYTHFQPTFSGGCTAYFRPCPYVVGCTLGDEYLSSTKAQLIFDKESKRELLLEDFLQTPAGTRNAQKLLS